MPRPSFCARIPPRKSRRCHARQDAIADTGLPASAFRSARPGFRRRPGVRIRGGWPGNVRPALRFLPPTGCRWHRPGVHPAPRNARRCSGCALATVPVRPAPADAGATSGQDCGARCQCRCTAHRPARAGPCRPGASRGNRFRCRSRQARRSTGHCARNGAWRAPGGRPRRRRRRGGRWSASARPATTSCRRRPRRNR
ncbi:hypothetical protein D3C73_1180740 [compost metagenome]